MVPTISKTNPNSTQMYIKKKDVAIIILFSKILRLRYKTYIIPSGLYAMELNCDKYKLIRAFLLLMYKQLNWDFFHYKGLQFFKICNWRI